MSLRYGSLAWMRQREHKERQLAKRDEYKPVADAPSTVRTLPAGELWHDVRGFHVLPEDPRAVRRCDCLDGAA